VVKSNEANSKKIHTRFKIWFILCLSAAQAMKAYSLVFYGLRCIRTAPCSLDQKDDCLIAQAEDTLSVGRIEYTRAGLAY
jgi:hypothetical protein